MTCTLDIISMEITPIEINNFFFKECAKGYYGNGCSEVCGHCVDQNGCHHINGSCLNGCKEGYMGDLCKTGMYE